MKTILFSIQVYWSSHFILPKAVIKNIEQLLRSFLWKGDDVSKGCGKVAWDIFRNKGPPVSWHKAVWFSGMVPRHALILWLAVRGRLSTLDRLASFGITQTLTCPLCLRENECLDHILFSCQFANQIWHLLFGKCNLPCPYLCWGDLLQDVATRFKGKSLRDLIVRLMLAAGVYIIWKERNFRLFSRKNRDVSSVFQDIVLHVRLRACSFSGFPPTLANRCIVNSWAISENFLLSG